MKRICVFCGSNAGHNPIYRAEAEKLGRLLAARGIELVYGAGNIGLMGAVANACLEAGGTVIGVIPEALMGKEVAGRAVDHRTLTRIEVVDSMHTRKARMAELSDGFIALPGGFGTFEEFCEILTWGQLGFHAKPMGLLNVNGFYDPLLAMFDKAVAEGFLRAQNRAMALADTDIEKLLATMTAYRPEPVSKWLKEEKQL
ncbi:MAG: TIGR00730 family Rossman fold protein [Gammaproteobacteria bacterium]|nr:TIGR00730 family Rossman fold protein [Gammaproteobacteria bacterium]MBU1600512.1 TIGR00730 family Rossman fold protein [Gammaproteobacteria bacterium]MBU2434968.1 TIGR00730 family Rossman fold protein [Gammaproteobacteria bacterium]MBU2448204.1 TIGR00730 family Rossman fold protein [Gammaproteobacteria bacterium]